MTNFIIRTIEYLEERKARKIIDKQRQFIKEIMRPSDEWVEE